MRDERLAQRCSSENGTVLPFVAAGMTVLLLLLALALDQGIRYSGRTQLQQLVDAAAQAALIALGRPNATRADADRAARDVVRMTAITGGTLDPSEIQVQFGSYNFTSRTFATGTSETPQAVRVSANKSGASGFQGLSGAITANAESVAALRCRNLVFVQDVSSSFREDIGKIQNALRATIDFIRSQESGLGIETRVGLVAFRNIVVPAGTTSELTPIGERTIDTAIDRLDDSNVLCGDPIRRVGDNIFVPACVGSDLRAGLQKAQELLMPGGSKNAACEDFVLAISDGVPCRVLESDLEASLSFFEALFVDVQFDTPRAGEPAGGGSTPEDTLAFVNSSMRGSGSIAVLTTNSDDTVRSSPTNLNDFLKTCPTARTRNAQQRQFDAVFSSRLINGFGQAFTSDPNAMTREMRNALRTLPPVVVQ